MSRIRRVICRIRGHAEPKAVNGYVRGVRLTVIVCSRCHRIAGVANVGKRSQRREAWRTQWKAAKR